MSRRVVRVLLLVTPAALLAPVLAGSVFRRKTKALIAGGGDRYAF